MNTLSLTFVLIAQVNAGVVSSVVLAVVAVISFIFGIFQYRMRIKENRSEILTNLMANFRKDPDMQSFFQMIDYGEHWYGPQFHNGPKETTADNTFLFFENVLQNKENGSLQENDFASLKYYIGRIVQNRDAQTYFYNLYHFTKQVNQDFPYKRLVNYAIKGGFLDAEEFEKKDSDHFKKVLAF